MWLTRPFSLMAGIHCVPHYDYLARCGDDTVRVMFDQDGTLYPRDATAPLPRPQRIGHNYAFKIHSHLQQAGYTYGPAEVEAALVSVGDEIVKKILNRSARHLTVLIHGYNNGYAAARDNYQALRARLDQLIPEPTVYLEVFWDGLCRGPVTFPLPLSYWFKSLTYSNLAGQVGLRAVLNRLPTDLSVFMCTHSRGAGVALSAIADPLWDRRMVVPPAETSRLPQSPSVAVVCLAPAVGNGHPLSQIKSALPSRSSVGIGFNALDPALSKSVANPAHFGDTSLGSVDRVYRAEEARLNRDRPWLYRSCYEGNPSHDLSRYLSHMDGQPFDALVERARQTLNLQPEAAAA